MKIDDLTSKIIKASYSVHNVLGSGFLEKIYHRALMIELIGLDLKVLSEVPIQVYYKGNNVGDFYGDLYIEDRLLIEIKAVENLLPVHEVQLVNYLNATGEDIGLLINFGKSVTVKRKYRCFV